MKPEFTFKSGFVAIAGRPNVGKSTLVNALLGQPIAAVTPRPQTTRRQQLGILTLEEAQVVFVDTPGFHKPAHKLGEMMNEEALQAYEDVDALLVLVDGSEPPTEEDRLLAAKIAEVAQAAPHLPVFLAVNKVDLLETSVVEGRLQVFKALFPSREALAISAANGTGLDRLVDILVASLPAGEPLYPADQVTDLYEREIAADLIRAAALLHLRDEVPHAMAVRVDEYTERNEAGAFIAATLFVERESQKGIVIGKGGMMLKQIGTTARQQIESMSGRKVFLQLNVKVRPNWRNDEQVLERFGFSRRKSGK